VRGGASVWAQPLRDLMKKNGYGTDKEIAARAGVSEKVVARVRKGHRISLDSADRLCMAFDTSLAEQYGDGEGEPTEADRAAYAKALARDEATRAR
jgi:transcriptional regulator with XRE-family HTH domain